MGFNKDFIFGAATASYQIEGGTREDGRSDSIWDTFCRVPGKVKEMHNGDIACDSYHKYKEDIKLLKELGVDAYRFSIAWPRIFPEKDLYNPLGMEYYKRLVSELKKENIKVVATIYHWDLPQWMQEIGGWANRECAAMYCEYASKCFEELDGLVDMWITINEPFCSAFLGYYEGCHAPGRRSMQEGIAAGHHLLLAHGMAVKLFREKGYKGKIGITLDFTPQYPATDSFLDRLATNNAEGYYMRWFIEAVFKKRYPFDICNLFASSAPDLNFIIDGDFDLISRELDFLGVNYYTSNVVEYCPAAPLHFSAITSGKPQTGIGWDISPEAMKDLIIWIRRNYTELPILISENGSAWPDRLEEDGVHDTGRIEYLEKHLKVIEDLNDEGNNVIGYLAWSLVDNFEWAYGYTERFGIVYIDYDSQRRITKDSYHRYRQIIENRSL